MNKPLLKFITDFGPLLIFFTFYYQNEKSLQVAIPPFIIATILSLGIIYLLEKKIPLIPLTSGILITFFGGLTIYFNNPIFLYMKPTIINVLFGFILLFGKYFSEENLLKKLLGNSIKLKDEGNVTVSRSQAINPCFTNENVPFLRMFQPRNRSKCCCFTATGRPQHDQKLPILGLKADVVDSNNVLKPLGQISKLDFRHTL